MSDFPPTQFPPVGPPPEPPGSVPARLAFVGPVGWTLIGFAFLLGCVFVWLVPVEGIYPWLSRISNPERNPQWVLAPIFSVLPALPRYAMLLLAVTLAMVVLAMLASSLRWSRRRRVLVVLGHLANALRLGVPLPGYLRTAAVGESAPNARRLKRLAGSLEHGEPLGAALRRPAGEMPAMLLDRITAAERSFTLGQAIDPLLDHERLRLDAAARTRPAVTYALMVAGVMLSVTGMIMVFVIPKFAQIFNDFRVPMPPATRTMILAYPPVLAALAAGGTFVVLLVMLGTVTRQIFNGVPTGPGLIQGVFDRVLWHVPVVGRLIADRQYAAVCEVLDDALRAGRPLPDAVGLATLPSLNAVLHGRMTRWQRRSTDGQPPAAAARAAGLPELLTDLMAASQTSQAPIGDDRSGGVQGGGDLAGAVAFAGRTYAAASERRAALLGAAAPMLVTFVAAAAVLFVAVALIQPIATLVESIPTTGRP